MLGAPGDVWGGGPGASHGWLLSALQAPLGLGTALTQTIRPLPAAFAPACFLAAMVTCQGFILGPCGKESSRIPSMHLAFVDMGCVSWPALVSYSPCICPFAGQKVSATGWPPSCLPSWSPHRLPGPALSPTSQCP